jgi:hypothetical protein
MYRYSYNILFSEEDKMKNLMCNFGFRGWAASNVENYPAFRQTLRRWQLQCLPKRWIILNIRRGSSSKAEVTLNSSRENLRTKRNVFISIAFLLSKLIKLSCYGRYNGDLRINVTLRHTSLSSAPQLHTSLLLTAVPH